MYIFVHVIFEKIAAGTSAMTVKDSKITAFGPASFVVGFGNVHDDGDAIFVVIFDQAVKGVDGVALDEAVAFLDEIGVLYFRDFEVFLRLLN